VSVSAAQFAASSQAAPAAFTHVLPCAVTAAAQVASLALAAPKVVSVSAAQFAASSQAAPAAFTHVLPCAVTAAAQVASLALAAPKVVSVSAAQFAALMQALPPPFITHVFPSPTDIAAQLAALNAPPFISPAIREAQFVVAAEATEKREKYTIFVIIFFVCMNYLLDNNKL